MGANPGRVVEVIENPVPRPRQPAQFSSPEFLALKNHLEELIHPRLAFADDEKLPVIKITMAGDDVE